jgi:L-alanine-DL-glutamate epimerase-like enolase superfamily enzyme
MGKKTLKFGRSITTYGTCARAQVMVEDTRGKVAVGWGETPLSANWSWPSSLPYEERNDAMKRFSTLLAEEWGRFDFIGHPMEIGHAFVRSRLADLLAGFNKETAAAELMPWLSGLICCSPFDLALHDAFGVAHGVAVYGTYNSRYMNHDLGHYLEPAKDTEISFDGRYPEDYFVKPPPGQLVAWHLVGGTDKLSKDELDGTEPDDGYPVLLDDWIKTDGLKCLKVKLRGDDAEWDYDRLVAVGRIGLENSVLWLTCDFNCTVTDPAYVNDILDRLMINHPRIYGMVLYVEQPYPYELEEAPIDVHSNSARKPLFMDESAHDWQKVALGRKLGWTGVALKTCKTQTGALLSLVWAKAHGMTLMVQDLTNPMLAQLSHLLLAAHAGTIMGVETNCMQFYPAASAIEEKVHPDAYRRRNGRVGITSLEGSGFGYRLAEIDRELPSPEVALKSPD